MPDPIGVIRYSLPRAVQVREQGNVTEVHSAVSGTINVYTDTMTEANCLIDNWHQIIEAANAKASELLSSVAGSA